MKTKNILYPFLTFVFVLGTLTMNAQTKVYVHKSNGSSDEYNIADIDSISFTPRETAAIDYSNLKLNEISGVGSDSEKFYEFFNTGAAAINLEGCKLYYNNAPATDATDGSLTWTGSSTQVINGNALFALIGRNKPGSFTTGLTAKGNIKITLRDPAGNLIDEFKRSDYVAGSSFEDKSFSRIPNGTGDFYYTTPTPGALNPASTDGLTRVN